MAQFTLSHSEENKGWTSFWNYIPDGMCYVGNRFYSIKNGQLYFKSGGGITALSDPEKEYHELIKKIYVRNFIPF